MSAEPSRRREVLEDYRDRLIRAVTDVGQQQALAFDREWGEEAYEALERLAADGLEFTADQLLELVGAPNAIGAVFGKASRAGLIRMVGVRTSKRISRHGGLQRVWVGVRVMTGGTA